MVISPLEYIVSILAPHECRICRREGYMLCFACAENNVFAIESRCYLCNSLTKQNRVCASCRSKSSIRRVWWLGHYKDLVKQLIREAKYQHKRACAREFGAHLASMLPYLPSETYVVPVPTASSRVRQRGYDQAVLIAKEFAKQRNLRFLSVLQRTSQADQIGKRRDQRFKQMSASLRLKNISVQGRSIILIDDIVTTGATIETAAKLLRKAGAKHVDAAAVARHIRG